MTDVASDIALLASPITFAKSGRVAPNRFLKSAMSERLCTWDDDEAHADSRGKPTKEYLKLYEEWGQGLIGTIILGNIPVNRRYPETKGNPIIDKTSSWDAVEAFKPVIAASKAGGSLVIAQLTHAGRQTNNTVAKVPISSSDVATGPLGGMTFNKPRPMTIPEIEDLADRFAFASKVLYEAGADGVQLHAAHGYLISQFLSPRVNKRTDKYGGSYENRTRMLFEIIAAIRERVPDTKFILSIKINSADFSEGGFSAEESRETIVRLEAAGLDLIELSGGTYESLSFEHKRPSTLAREAFFIEFAAKIRPHLKVSKLAVTGGFRSLTAMASAIREGSCDSIGLGRPLTAEPYLDKALLEGKTLKAKENLVPAPLQTPASVFQITEIGKGLPVRDFSDEKVAAATAQTMMLTR